MAQAAVCDVFISYARKDSWCKEELVTMLAPKLRQGSIKIFDDTMIVPGTRWEQKLVKMLFSARVALLLLSPSFLNSDFIMKNEWPIVKKRADDSQMVLFWVLVDDCLIEHTDINKYQAAWSGPPLHRLLPAKRNEALKQICEKLLMALSS